MSVAYLRWTPLLRFPRKIDAALAWSSTRQAESLSADHCLQLLVYTELGTGAICHSALGRFLKMTIICLMHLIYILPEELGLEHKTTFTRKVKPLKPPQEGKWTSHKDTVLTAPRGCLLWRVCSHRGTKCSLFLFSGWCYGHPCCIPVLAFRFSDNRFSSRAVRRGGRHAVPWSMCAAALWDCTGIDRYVRDAIRYLWLQWK